MTAVYKGDTKETETTTNRKHNIPQSPLHNSNFILVCKCIQVHVINSYDSEVHNIIAKANVMLLCSDIAYEPLELSMHLYSSVQAH